jgi:sodium pump decarboxylase gamma subunit
MESQFLIRSNVDITTARVHAKILHTLENPMISLSENPWLVTVFGMSVVLITLAILMFITKFVSFFVKLTENKKHTPEPTTHLNTAATPENDNVMAIIAAAVHAVLGPKTRIVGVRGQKSERPSPWVNASRWSQLQSQLRTFGRK